MRRPIDRFKITDNCFDYIPQDIFAIVYSGIQKMKKSKETCFYSLAGPTGTRKSHVLAALACLLLSQGYHIIYLGDYRILAQGFVVCVKEALLLAFKDDERV